MYIGAHGGQRGHLIVCSNWPGIPNINQTDLKLTEIPLLLLPKGCNEGLCHHAQLIYLLKGHFSLQLQHLHCVTVSNLEVIYKMGICT